MNRSWLVLALAVTGCASQPQRNYADDWAHAPLPTDAASIAQECRSLASTVAQEGGRATMASRDPYTNPILIVAVQNESVRRQSVLNQRMADLGCGMPAYARAPPPGSIPPPASPRSTPGGDFYEQMIQLNDLHKKGLLSDQEFEARRDKLVSGK